jgi:aminomethyltransferase
MPTESLAITPAMVPSDLARPLAGSAFAPIDGMGFIRIAGEDRVRWLNGMTTNSIQSLQPGEGCYTFFLNAQGRIQGDATAWLLPDSILLETQRDRIDALVAHLDRFIIMDDVELASPEERTALTLLGPQATAILESLALPVPGELQLVHAAFHGAPIDILHVHSPLVPRFELWATPARIEDIAEALGNAGATPTSAAALEHLRLLEGTPLYGTDIRDRDLPQETGQTRALHFAKGCYLGQEIVERIRSRGNVHRALNGFILTGPIPMLPAPLFDPEAPEKILGELTSAARIELPTGAVTLALGIVRREALERNTAIHYENGTAIPTKLPYSS